MDPEATLQSLVETSGTPDQELAFVVELRDKPAPGMPSLAAIGSEDSVIPPKNAKAAVSYQVSRGPNGRIVRRTPAPTPPPQGGYDFNELHAGIDVSDLTAHSDFMQVTALRNVLSNNFSALISIFLHYAQPRQLAADGGLRGEQRRGRARDAARAHHRAEHFDMTMAERRQGRRHRQTISEMNS